MRTLCLVLVIVGWAASGVDWTHDAVAQDAVADAAPSGKLPVVPQQVKYLPVKTLDAAIEVLQTKFKNSHSPISPLISKDTVRASILTSLEGIGRTNEKAIRDSSYRERTILESSAKYFDDVVAPIYAAILKDEKWPIRAYFIDTKEGSAHLVYLHVDTRKPDGAGYDVGGGGELTGYSLPILTVEFGHSGPADYRGTLEFDGNVLTPIQQ